MHSATATPAQAADKDDDRRRYEEQDTKDGERPRSGRKAAPEQEEGFFSESERLLFGGRLRYDMGWSQHDAAATELTLRCTLMRLPQMLARLKPLPSRRLRAALPRPSR